MQELTTIFLIGPRASGKTALGSLLAAELGYDHADTDQAVAKTIGTSIAELVRERGWDEFRRLEGETLRAIIRPGLVVSTGGGMVLAETNRACMRDNGVTLYLQAPAEILAARLTLRPDTASRPSLTGRPVIEEVGEILAQREPLYLDAAHHVVDASAGLDQVLAAALQCVRNHRRPA
ncbi:MAG: shikimate kinase AroL [Planctomycetes bacterium]|nr:shikimate kinase AroL [Planctomycetota bacterium]